MILSAVLFGIFALLAAAGAYLIGLHFWNRRTGVLSALGVLVFFAALGSGLVWLVVSAEGLP